MCLRANKGSAFTFEGDLVWALIFVSELSR